MSAFNSCSIPIMTGACEGDCCGMVPIPIATYKKNQDKIQRRPSEVLDFNDETVLPITAELKCVFLTKEFRCAIYHERPEVCRKFATGDPHPCLQCPHGVVTGEYRNPPFLEKPSDSSNP